MRFPRTIILAVLTVAGLAMGNAGLRVLHVAGGCDAAMRATASADGHCDRRDAHSHADHCADHCADHRVDHRADHRADHRDRDADAFPADGHGDDTPADDGTAPDGCVTCELLLALAGLGGQAVPAPTLHALVAVTDDDAPARLPAPAPIRALAARPPPAC